MECTRYEVDRDGNAYVVSHIMKDKAASIHPHYEIFKMTSSSSNYQRFPLHVKGKSLSSPRITEDSQGTILFAGYYSWEDYGMPAGIYFGSISKESVSDIVIDKFPVELLNEHSSSANQRRNVNLNADGKMGVDYLRLKDVIIQDDDGILVVGEQYYYGLTGDNSKGRHECKNIFIARLDKTGSVVWMRKISKEQHSSNSGDLISYRYQKLRDKHYFLFKDERENLDLSKHEIPSVYKSRNPGVLIGYSVDDKNAGTSKSIILDTKDSGSADTSEILMSQIVFSEAGEIMLEVRKTKKQNVLIRIEPL